MMQGLIVGRCIKWPFPVHFVHLKSIDFKSELVIFQSQNGRDPAQMTTEKEIPK